MAAHLQYIHRYLLASLLENVANIFLVVEVAQSFAAENDLRSLACNEVVEEV